MRYGKWTVIEKKKGTKENNWKNKWLCRCDCGTESWHYPDNLRSGKSTQCRKCGPLSHERHGLYKHKLYAVWQAMKQRVENENHPSFINYGLRGITLAEEWKDPEKFVAWCLDNGWKKGLQLDRRDNNGPYSPDNCRFITQQENLRNSRTLSIKNSTGFRGVSKTAKPAKLGRFVARVMYEKRLYHIGVFDTPEEAARARDKCVKDNGFNLPLNFPEEKNVSR